MEILRTPDERFSDLVDFPFKPNYVEVPAEADSDQKLRIHYVDEGLRTGALLLLMHGEPSWSYLYRKMIPTLVEDGFRVIVPDLPGFGRSDKPAAAGDYTYQRLVDWMEAALIHHLDLTDITMFCQDWGGLVGLRLVAAHPERFHRIMVSNTGLPTGHGEPPKAFLDWQQFSQSVAEFPTSGIINGGCVNELSAAELAAYDAPFPDESFKAGARVLPSLVPTSTHDPAHDAQMKAWEVLRNFHKPCLTAFSDSDPITRGGQAVFQKRIPGAHGLAHVTILGAGHFLQEDQPDQICTQLMDFVALDN